MSSAVRISPDSHRRLKKIAEDEGLSLTEALDRAIDAYRRDRMLADVNHATRLSSWIQSGGQLRRRSEPK